MTTTVVEPSPAEAKSDGVTVVTASESTGDGPEEADGAAAPAKKASPVAKVTKKKKWKKPKDKPKRPLSAYNIFFRHEREKLLYAGNMDGGRRKRNKIGFADLAKTVAAKWKKIEGDARKIYEAQAEFEQIRYKAEVEEWKRNQNGGGGGPSSFRKPGDSRTAGFVVKTMGHNDTTLEDLINQQQSRDALINQLMISQFMANNYGNNGNNNNGNNNNGNSNGNCNNTDNSGMGRSQMMGQMYSNPMMVNAEVQSQLNYLTGGEGSLDSLVAYATANTNAAAGAPRRMSMPTTSGQYAQMQQQQHAQQQQQQQQMPSMGGRRLSMPLGIIDNTNQTHASSTERRSSMPMNVGGGYYQQHQQHHQQQYQSVDDMQLHMSQQQQQLNNMEQQQHGGTCSHMMDGASRRMSMPSNTTGHASVGRRMSMPLSVEQQVLDRGSEHHQQAHGQSSYPAQCRSMSMPLGMSDPVVQDPRAHENLDELADILRDDTDLFDW